MQREKGRVRVRARAYNSQPNSLMHVVLSQSNFMFKLLESSTFIVQRNTTTERMVMMMIRLERLRKKRWENENENEKEENKKQKHKKTKATASEERMSLIITHGWHRHSLRIFTFPVRPFHKGNAECLLLRTSRARMNARPKFGLQFLMISHAHGAHCQTKLIENKHTVYTILPG